VNIPACAPLATALLLHQAPARLSADNGGETRGSSHCLLSSEGSSP